MEKYDYDLDLEELEQPKPLSAERRAELDELINEIAVGFAEINRK